ncbi:MAG: hypothetical protein WA366_27235 [Pseudolabrys sp.]
MLFPVWARVDLVSPAAALGAGHAAAPLKAAIFSRNAFVQFTGMSDVIFELAVTLDNLAQRRGGWLG